MPPPLASPPSFDHGPATEAQSRVRGARFAAAIIGTAPLSPILAGLVTVAADPARSSVLGSFAAAPQTPLASLTQVLGQPLVASLLHLVVAWLALACFYWLLGFERADRVDARSYGSLRVRRDHVASRLQMVGGQLARPTESQSGLARSAYVEACDHVAALDLALNMPGPGWVLGHAYMNVWRRLNRAEEALLECAPTALTLSEAKIDALRLTSSMLDHSGAMLAGLRTAIDSLERDCRAQAPLHQPPADGVPSVAWAAAGSAYPATAALGLTTTATPLVEADSAPAVPVGGTTEPLTVDEARSWIRQVRLTIDDYRFERWVGLLHARNRLLASIVFTSFTVYVLLWLSIVAGVEKSAILAVTAFYFVGATVGLFNRLYSDAAAGPSSIGSDYSLGTTRLIGIPLLSGVAAVLGVLLQTTLASATAGTGSANTLTQALDFAGHPINVLTSALFGLTPGLVLDRLKAQTEHYREELDSLHAGHSDASASATTHAAKASRGATRTASR